MATGRRSPERPPCRPAGRCMELMQRAPTSAAVPAWAALLAHGYNALQAPVAVRVPEPAGPAGRALPAGRAGREDAGEEACSCPADGALRWVLWQTGLLGAGGNVLVALGSHAVSCACRRRRRHDAWAEESGSEEGLPEGGRLRRRGGGVFR